MFLLLLAVWTMGCLRDESASSQSQRRIGEVRLQDDIFVSLTYGAIRGFTEDEIVMRSASPLVQISTETGPNALGPIDVELRNQHLDAELRVASVTYLDSQDVDGCPVVTGASVDCIAASDAIGRACEGSGECPVGLRCGDMTCTPTNLYDGCETPAFERLDGQETSIDFDLDAAPCRRTLLETYLPEDDGAAVRFAVVGPSRDVDLISGLGNDFRERDVDFVVLLGDNVDEANLDGLIRLERALIQLGTPSVVIAGPREVEPDGGEEFLRRFGPHDHVWTLRGARFFTFYSALGTLGPRGLSRLQSFLLRLQPADPDATDTPLIGMTHVPPLDPNGLADNGFRNEIEALQVLSVLEEHAVHQLFAGGRQGEEAYTGVDVFVTTARGTLTAPKREWLLVEITDDGAGRTVGERSLSVERIEIE